MIAAVLWDLDGTIVDPAGAITGGIADALETHGFRRPSETEMQRFVGPPVTLSLSQFTDVPRESFADIIATYRSFYRSQGIAQSKLYPGILPILKNLHADGIHQLIATQKPLYLAHKVLEHFEISGYFTVVSGAPDELGEGNQTLPTDKPGIILHALQELEVLTGLEVDKNRAVMIGDRLYDARGAADNGLISIGVAWGFGDQQELEKEFDYLAVSAGDLEPMIQECVA